MTDNVHKKLEHINAKFAEKLAKVHEEYRKLMLEQSSKYEDEIKDIEVEKKRALDNAQLSIDDIIKRTAVQIEQITNAKKQYKAAYEKKSSECLELRAALVGQQERMAELEITISAMEQSIRIAAEAKQAEIE